MAFIIVKEDSVATEGASTHISTSGIYTVTLKHAEAVKTTNGATQVNYFFDKIMSYGNNIIGVNGQPTFGYKIIEALATVVGTDELSDPEPTTVKFKKSTKELNCIPELNDVVVKAWIKFSYRMYKGEIQENVSVRRFYRETDNASGSEIITGENLGVRIGKDEAFASEVEYEDGVTPEAVVAWKEAERIKNGGAKAPAGAAATSAAKASGFPGAGKDTTAKKPSGFPGA